MKPEAAILLGAMLFGAGWCLIVGAFVHGDPLLWLEGATIGLGLVWAARLAISLRRARQLACQLRRYSSAQVVDGITVNVVRGGGMTALVTGAVRPAIYVGDLLVRELDVQERHAVLLHESHHRATHAPLRAAAIDAWISVAGSVAPFRRVLVERLVDLERLADAHALAHGSSAASLASALLKTDPAPLGVAASRQAAPRRVRALLSGEPVSADVQLAYEWLPVAVAVMAAAACHTLGLALG